MTAASLQQRTWVWLGFDDLYVRRPGHHEWQPLRDAEDPALPWSVEVAVADGGCERLRRPGQRLGLGTPPAARRLDQVILQALCQELNSVPVLWAPPHQMPGLVETLRAFTPPTPSWQAVMEVPLLRGREAMLLHPNQMNPDEDVYLFNSQTPAQGVARRFFPDCPAKLPKLVPPVLMEADAYARGEWTVLGRYVPGGLKEKNRIKLTPVFRAAYDRQPLSVALVWAWGFGLRLWQWALPPVMWPDMPALYLHLEPPYRCYIDPIQKYPVKEHTLQPPIIQWKKI